jgi:hypothetical protein
LSSSQEDLQTKEESQRQRRLTKNSWSERVRHWSFAFDGQDMGVMKADFMFLSSLNTLGTLQIVAWFREAQSSRRDL